jgi:signal transduction histidine kinase
VRVDALLAAVVFAEALVEAAFVDDGLGARATVVLPAGLMAGALALRRRRPLPASVLAGAAIASLGLLHQRVADGLEGVFVAWLFVNYSLASREDGRPLLAGTIAGLAAIAALVALEPDPSASDALFGVVIFLGAPTFAGRMLRSRVRLGHALAAKAEQIDRERGRRAEEAVAGERARIAGELHDVVAHALGAMTVQAAAARRLADKDAARAGGAFEAIEHTGREALGEIRTLLEVLRGEEDPDEPALAPQPSLSALHELAADMRRAGLAVEVSQEGDAPEKLPTGVDLTAYRVVQEALETALEAGGARTAGVLVRFAGGELAIEIADDGARDGRSLVGLQERLRVFGGRVVEEGGAADSGYVLRAILPLEGVPA